MRACTCLEEFCLISRKGAAYSQIEFLTRVDAERLVFVGFSEISERSFNVLLRDGRKFCSPNVLKILSYCLTNSGSLTSTRRDLSTVTRYLWMEFSGHALLDRPDNFEANVLAFLVAIQPQDKVITVSAFLAQKRRYPELRSRFFLLSRTREEFSLRTEK